MDFFMEISMERKMFRLLRRCRIEVFEVSLFLVGVIIVLVMIIDKLME